MNRKSLILTVTVIGCICLSQFGCQQEPKVVETSETELANAEPILKSVPPATKVEPTATTEPEQVPETKRPAPIISFEKTTHDFDQIGPATSNPCEFKFTNTGDNVLKITKIQSTCGCTVAKLDKREYNPGESGSIEVTYRSSRGGGKVHKTIYVSSNDKKNPRVALHIRGTVVQKVRHQPDQLRLLLTDKEANSVRITLASIDGKPFSIKSFTATGGGITASFDRSEEKTRFVLEPKLDLGKLKERPRGTVRISLTHPQCNMVTIPFSVLPRFETQPRSILVRNAEPLKPVTREEVWVLNNYGEDFEIESTSSSKGTVKLLKKEKVAGDNRYELTLQITPPKAEGKVRVFTDVFYVNLKGGEQIRIDCRGFYARTL